VGLLAEALAPGVEPLPEVLLAAALEEADQAVVEIPRQGREPRRRPTQG